MTTTRSYSPYDANNSLGFKEKQKGKKKKKKNPNYCNEPRNGTLGIQRTH